MGINKNNVVIDGKRTSITINSAVVDLLEMIDGTPTMQELVDEEIKYRTGLPVDGKTLSSWVTEIICIQVLEQYRSGEHVEVE